MNNGLYLCGTVIGRYKKTKQSEKGPYTSVKYIINCDGQIFEVTETNPTDTYGQGEVVEIPVRARIYNGGIYYGVERDRTAASNF